MSTLLNGHNFCFRTLENIVKANSSVFKPSKMKVHLIKKVILTWTLPNLLFVMEKQREQKSPHFYSPKMEVCLLIQWFWFTLCEFIWSYRKQTLRVLTNPANYFFTLEDHWIDSLWINSEVGRQVKARFLSVFTNLFCSATKEKYYSSFWQVRTEPKKMKFILWKELILHWSKAASELFNYG